MFYVKLIILSYLSCVGFFNSLSVSFVYKDSWNNIFFTKIFHIVRKFDEVPSLELFYLILRMLRICFCYSLYCLLSFVKGNFFSIVDTVYSERYMGLPTPEDNLAGYEVQQ